MHPLPPAPRTGDLPSWLYSISPYWLHGCEGGENAQVGLVNSLSEVRTKLSLGIVQGLLFWMWQQRPLSFVAATLAHGLHASAPFLPPLAAAIAARIMDLPETDALASAPADCLHNRNAAWRHLPPLVSQPDIGLAVLAQAWEAVLLLGDATLAHGLLGAATWPSALIPLRQRLAAEVDLHLGGLPDAMARVNTVDDNTFPHWQAYVLAELAARGGDNAMATKILERLWAAMPWHTNLTLKLASMRASRPPALPVYDAPPAAVCLYTWNKAGPLGGDGGPLRQTLESLADSALHGAHELILNNGSTDSTAQVLAQAGALFPQGRCTVITLPVNVGAPPARNWLLSRPEAQAARYAAFLDDDIILPPNWLSNMLAHAEAWPQAGSIGCRIVDALPPRAIQCTDYHLMPPGRIGVSSFRDFQERLFIHENFVRSPDLGLFDYLRPCQHVSGCCHLVRMAAVADAGLFDVRFNPTQFDDLERDLRQGLRGWHSLYVGTTAVRHMQHSSLAKARSALSMAQVLGNKLKLEHLFDDAQIRSLAEDDHRRMLRHLAAAYTDLHESLPGKDDAAQSSSN